MRVSVVPGADQPDLDSAYRVASVNLDAADALGVFGLVLTCGRRAIIARWGRHGAR